MAYNNAIPQPGDSPAVDSQAQLLENFAQLNTQFSFDHIAFTALADNGMHTKISINDINGVAPGTDPGLPDPQVSLYTKTIAGDSELFFEKFDNGTALNVVQQMTNLAIANLGNPGSAGGTLYRVDLPIGITIYMGSSIAFSGNRAVTFPVAYTAIYSTTATPNDPAAQGVAVTQGVGGLTLRTLNSIIVNWISIGTI